MKPAKIPAAFPRDRFAPHEEALMDACRAVIRSDSYILGKQVRTFEKAFAEYHGVKHCIGVSSATAALTLALRASGIRPGDEVITTSITAPATVVSILNTPAIPVIVDVEAPTYCISPDAIRAAITQFTKAIIPVHLHGFAARMDTILNIAQDHGLIVIEDCAQGHGARYQGQRVGTFGHCSAFSFYPTKNLPCLGDAGAVVTDNKIIAEHITQLRQYGFNAEGLVESLGRNARLPEMQAAFLNVLLPTLEKENSRRFTYAQKYVSALQEFPQLLPPIIEGAVYHQFAIRHKRRDEIRLMLQEMGVSTGIHYPNSMSSHPLFKTYCRNISVAQQVVKEFISLPIQPEILDKHFDRIVKCLLICLRN